MPALQGILKNPHARSARGWRQKLFFSDESQWTITPDPIITLQPRQLPLPHNLAGKHSSFCFSLKINSLRIPVGQTNVQNAQSMQSFHAIVNGSSWYWAPGGILCYEAYREESGTTRSNRNLRAKSH